MVALTAMAMVVTVVEEGLVATERVGVTEEVGVDMVAAPSWLATLRAVSKAVF